MVRPRRRRQWDTLRMGSRRLQARAAIVTGAAEGIGWGIAAAFAREGANLVLVGRTLDKLVAAADELASTGAAVRVVQGTVGDRATAQRAVAEAADAFQ